MEKFGYVVKFDNGWYAEKQPDHDWRFTRDLSKAMVYKTIKGARERSKDGTSYGLGEVSKIMINYVYEVVPMTDGTEEAKEAIIENEKARLTKKFKDACEKDGDDFSDLLEKRLKKFKTKL